MPSRSRSFASDHPVFDHAARKAVDGDRAGRHHDEAQSQECIEALKVIVAGGGSRRLIAKLLADRPERNRP